MNVSREGGKNHGNDEHPPTHFEVVGNIRSDLQITRFINESSNESGVRDFAMSITVAGTVMGILEGTVSHSLNGNSSYYIYMYVQAVLFSALNKFKLFVCG